MKALWIVSSFLLMANISMAGQCTLTTKAQLLDDSGLSSIEILRVLQLDSSGSGNFVASYSGKGAAPVYINEHGSDAALLNSDLISMREGDIEISVVNNRTISVTNDSVSSSNGAFLPIEQESHAIVSVPNPNGVTIGFDVDLSLQLTCTK